MHAVEVLSWPSGFTGFGAGCQNELVVGQGSIVVEEERFLIVFDIGNQPVDQVDPVLFPEMIFIGFDILEAHVAHVDVHERGTGEEVVRFCRNDGYLVVAELSDMPGGGDAGNSVSKYNYMHRKRYLNGEQHAKSFDPCFFYNMSHFSKLKKS